MIAIKGELFESEEMTAVAEEIRTTPEDVELVVNSPGGDVFVGLDIANAILNCTHKVTATVETIAASAAAVIAVACDKVKVDKNSIIMLHYCWTIAMGDKQEMEQQAKAMETIDNVLLSIISEHCKDPEELKARMDVGDVWLTGEEFAELFDNVELVEIQRPEEGKKAAYGGLGDYIAQLRTEIATLKAELLNKDIKEDPKPEPQYTNELKALLEVKM